MALLKTYLDVLKRLNYKEVSVKSKIDKLKRLVPRQSLECKTEQYRSSVLVSFNLPDGRKYSVTCTGEGKEITTAKTHALRYAVDFLANHLKEKHNITSTLTSQIVFDKAPLNRYELDSNNYVAALPFFKDHYFEYDRFIMGGDTGRMALGTSDRNVQIPVQRRYYSTPSTERRLTAEDEFNKAHEATLQCAAFAAPKNFVGNIYERVKRATGSNTPLKEQKMVKASPGWSCVLRVTWPTENTFSGTAATKKEAARIASVFCIEWLIETGKIDSKGNLQMVNKEEVMATEKKPLAEIKVDSSYIDEAEELIKYFIDNELPAKLKNQIEEWAKQELELLPDFSRRMNGLNNVSDGLLTKRNAQLYSRLNERKLGARNKQITKLPIVGYRKHISDLVSNNRVIVIKGETGCGKSTQVPQFILDDFTSAMKATDCSIVVTQPRRISAISLAQRIAFERQEAIGDVVGYQVRLQSEMPRRERGSILFCTTGILLRKILSNPDLKGVTHLIIDEAHERDLDTDLVLLLSKRALEKNRDLKIVVMSATINPELFQNYYDDAATLHVPGFTYPVDVRFLDGEMSRITGVTERVKSEFPSVNIVAVSKLITWINRNRPPGAVLVFLPGWSEINRLMNNLQTQRDLYVLPAHSRLSHDDQKRIFNSPPPGTRKVILATNIAETSITIDDVVYVIDPGAHKEERLSSEKTAGLSGGLCLDNQWISQANAKQRRGRAGRTKPGECFHLYTKNVYDSLNEFPLPEIHRTRLETTVLHAKVYSGNDNAEDFLNQLPQPPKKEMIKDAIKNLQWVGALDEEENLTPLGSRIAVFTTHPFISKALVHAHMFKCVNPMVTIATLLSADVDLFPGQLGDKTDVRDLKKRFSPTSDHLALAWLVQQWEDYNGHQGIAEDEGSSRKARELAYRTGVSEQRLTLIRSLKRMIAEHLYQCGLLDNVNDYRHLSSNCNTYMKNHELTKGVLLSGLGNVLSARNWDVQKGVFKKKNVFFTETGQRALVGSESVNFKRSHFPSPFMTYFSEVRSMQQRSITIRDTSIISPLTLILFQCATLNIHKSKDMKLENDEVIISMTKDKKKLHIICDERTAKTIIKFRQILWSVIGYLVREEGHPQDKKLLSFVKSYHDKLLSLLDKMLLEQSMRIDYDKDALLRT